MTRSLLALIASSLLLPGCNLLSDLTSKTYSIPASKVDGSIVLAQESALLGPQSVPIDLQGTLKQFPVKVHVDEIKIRTVFDNDTDKSEAALTNASYMSGCRVGQDRIDFISSIVIKIKKNGEPDSAFVELAQGNYDASQPCSINLSPNSSINLEDYASGYVLQVDPTGKYPDHPIYVGGYVTGSWSP